MKHIEFIYFINTKFVEYVFDAIMAKFPNKATLRFN